MVDWDLAVSLGSRLAGEGPEVTRAEAAAAVAELRAGADRSTGLVREFTGLVAGDRTAPGARRRPPRLGAGQRRRLRDPARPAHRQARRRRRARRPGSPRAIGSRVTGAEVGGLLGFLGRQGARPVRPVPSTRRAGRLLLVAPNIVHVERELGRRPARLPALGLPARGDPPGAVHRGAVDARPPLRRDAGDRRTLEPDARSSTTALKRVAEAVRGEAAAACST